MHILSNALLALAFGVVWALCGVLGCRLLEPYANTRDDAIIALSAAAGPIALAYALLRRAGTLLMQCCTWLVTR